MASDPAPDFSKYLATPLAVNWCVTSRCNLACPYCLESATAAGARDDATREERERIVDELVSCHVLKVYLSGGEPLLVAETPRYAARLHEAGVRVRLTTNGVLIDECLARTLADAGLAAAEVSLHPGTEDGVERGVAALVGARIPVVLRVVVTKRNAGRLRAFVERFVGSGVETISFQEVMPLGRASGDLETGTLSLDEARRVRDEVEALRKEFGEDRVAFSSATLSDAEIGHPVPCTLGKGNWKTCEIRPDGNVIPCAPAVVFGVRNSLHEKGLKRAWQDLPALYREFAEEDPGGACAACAFRETCRGGCRAICRQLEGPGGGNPACAFFRSCADGDA